MGPRKCMGRMVVGAKPADWLRPYLQKSITIQRKERSIIEKQADETLQVKPNLVSWRNEVQFLASAPRQSSFERRSPPR